MTDHTVNPKYSTFSTSHIYGKLDQAKKEKGHCKFKYLSYTALVFHPKANF